MRKLGEAITLGFGFACAALTVWMIIKLLQMAGL